MKANRQTACDATLHCFGDWPALSPADGWKTTVLRKKDTEVWRCTRLKPVFASTQDDVVGVYDLLSV